MHHGILSVGDLEQKNNFDNILSDASIEHFNKVIKSRPHSATPYYQRGLYYAQLGKIQQTKKYFLKEITDYRMAQLWARDSDPIKAIKAKASEALKNACQNERYFSPVISSLDMKDGDLTPYFTQAKRANKNKNFKQAVELCDAILELDPQWANVYYIRAFSHYSQGHLLNAMLDYRSVLALDQKSHVIDNPQIFITIHNLGLTYALLKEFDEAIKCFNQCILKNPSDLMAYCNRGMVHRDSGNLPAAMSDLITALSLAHSTHQSCERPSKELDKLFASQSEEDMSAIIETIEPRQTRRALLRYRENKKLASEKIRENAASVETKDENALTSLSSFLTQAVSSLTSFSFLSSRENPSKSETGDDIELEHNAALTHTPRRRSSESS